MSATVAYFSSKSFAGSGVGSGAGSASVSGVSAGVGSNTSVDGVSVEAGAPQATRLSTNNSVSNVNRSFSLKPPPSTYLYQVRKISGIYFQPFYNIFKLCFHPFQIVNVLSPKLFQFKILAFKLIVNILERTVIRYRIAAQCQFSQVGQLCQRADICNQITI